VRAMSFGAVADEYDRLRPDPAPEAVDWLLPDRRDQVVDLAAGTGKLTRALALRSGRVLAVEPDRRMGTVLRTSSPAIRVVAGLGEAIPVRDDSADGLFISSAWHWMDPPRAVPEIARVLRDGGRFGLIWTSRDREFGWIREIDSLREPDRDAGRAAMNSSRLRNREITLPDPSPFTDIETASFTYTRTMKADDLVEMIGTYSRVITASEEDKARTLASVRAELDARFPGAAEIEVPIRSLCWRATRLPR
jgi:SAM-dependent methyltransferase